MSQNLRADDDPLRKRPSPSTVEKCDLQHEPEKKMKPNGTQKFFASSRRQIAYSHNWSTGSGNVDEKIIVSSTTTKITNDLPLLGRIKKAQQCVDSGELADFSQELDYILSTLLDENASQNLKHLSAIQLAKKCTIAEFRRFLRTQNVLGEIFSALSDIQGLPHLAKEASVQMISLTTSTIIYFLARDQKSVPITDVTVRLISDLLRQEQNQSNSSDEFKKHIQTIWSIVKDWLNKCTERMKRPIHFGVTESMLTASALTLEALAYISTREQNDFFKTELLNSGCLQWVIAKLDKAVLKLSYSIVSDGTSILEEIERCFRVLENAAAFNKKNQAYLINHRNGLLLEAGAKFLSYFKDFCEKFDSAASSTLQSISGRVLNELLDCVNLLTRVLMNVSHENELCSKKLGQKEGFFHNCVTILTLIAPRIVPTEKFFDLCVMMYGLLVNLVERCAPNRQKMLELEVLLYDAETKDSSKFAVLDALTKLFVKHDAAAVKLDEELDNELAFEESVENEESSNQETNHSISQQSASSSTSQDEHRLQRPAAVTEDDVLNAVKGAMSKASAHMEDSMLASYLSLLVGCLLRMDQDLANHVKTLLPGGKLSIMIEQLERFLEFMKLTKMKSGATRSIEQIIQSMQLL